jgi:hypothetical protein
MNVTLYIELEGYDDGDFDVSNDYYKSDDEFFDIMDKDVKKYSNAVYNAMSRDGFNISSAKLGSLYKTTKNAKTNNYKSEAIIFDETGKDETVDNLIANCVSQDVVVNIIRFNRDKMDEEFEEDFNFWIDDHNNINQYKDKLGEDKVWENEPTRNLKVEFINNAGETKYAMYVNCKVLEQEGNDEYAILAEKIILLDEI